ncbi:Methyltransferase adrK [Drechslerella dactyloides]|uniref:Methyltransferase adrK n=1 Tax=Drechslerella dactyloides TaxID=74499 RepID=A0AAD6ISZ8_DREDA|nr:Methyltransferase adrK [Drechslerella dactyloides]
MAATASTRSSTETADAGERERLRKTLWFAPNETLALSTYAKDLFKNYSGIAEEDIFAHIIQVREKAWNVHPYPCIGSFRFLDFAILESPAYQTVVEKLRSGGKYLDMGCCFAQDLRALAYAGVPSENLYGADLRPTFIQLSYDLFNDKHKLRSTFFHGNVFDLSSFRKVSGDQSDPSLFGELVGKVDIISARSFLHVFGAEDEFRAACQMAQILSSSNGSMIIGRQVGSTKPGLNSISLRKSEPVFRHNVETWKAFWTRVGEETNTQWDVYSRMIDIAPEVKLSVRQAESRDIEDRAWLEFVVTRI